MLLVRGGDWWWVVVDVERCGLDGDDDLAKVRLGSSGGEGWPRAMLGLGPR